MPDGSRERLRHILVANTARTERFTSPRSGRGKPTKTPPRDRENHAGLLISELTTIEKSVAGIVRDQKAFGLDAFNGIYLSFESEPDFDLKFDSLEFQPSGIELFSVKRADNRTIATVFVPEGKLAYFLNKITAYRDEDTDKGKPKNKPLVESISHIRLAALEALWTDPADLFPAPSEVIWWEVWLRKSEQMNFEAFLRDHAEQLGTSVSKEAIHFLDRTVLLVRGTPEQMSRSVHLLASFAEVRKAKDTAAFFTGLDHIEQQKWIDNALKRLGDIDVEMRVTLSYFVESNPGERGRAKKYSYQSHGLRFDVRRSLESLEAFEQRINRQARDEEYDGSSRSGDTGEWVLGDRLRVLGSVHSDIWLGTATALAERGHVAVYPVLGWWKERPALERWGKAARYALVVSIRTPGVETDIYTPVLNQIAATVQV